MAREPFINAIVLLLPPTLLLCLTIKRCANPKEQTATAVFQSKALYNLLHFSTGGMQSAQITEKLALNFAIAYQQLCDILDLETSRLSQPRELESVSKPETPDLHTEATMKFERWLLVRTRCSYARIHVDFRTNPAMFTSHFSLRAMYPGIKQQPGLGTVI